MSELGPDAKDRIEELLVRHGLNYIPLTDINKEDAVKDLLIAEVLVTRTAALDSFFHGLNALGLGNLLCSNTSLSRIIFPSPEDATVDVQILKSKLLEAHVCREGDEEAVVNAWQWFLKYVDDSSSIGKYICTL